MLNINIKIFLHLTIYLFFILFLWSFVLLLLMLPFYHFIHRLVFGNLEIKKKRKIITQMLNEKKRKQHIHT